MKKTITFLSALIISLNVFSQISTNEIPFSFKEKLEKGNIPTVTMPALNLEIIEEEDSIDNLIGLPPRFGFDFDVDINMENSGQWTELPNKKGHLWQLEIYSPGALSINLLYDKFYIPKGGKFFIYSSDKNKKLGAFTYRNNKGDKMHPGAFATSLILSDRIILEYYSPANSIDIPVISISKVVHGYRYLPFLFGDSDDDCEININCNEGANWQDEKTSVALIVVGGTRLCTGSLINNTRGDGAPFLLTANHCIDYSGLDAISNPNASNWTFLWNYESPTCANGTDFTPPSTSGATVIANNSASDFALLELDETPFDLTPSLCLYYNGWDKSGSTPTNLTCIHHPAGDIKKISISNSSPSTDGNYWEVIFNQGITEGGSSGSPLFDQNSRVVGQLLGTLQSDPISCQNQDGPTFYGKFSISWNNSTDSRRRLKDWLDPLGTNPNTLNGAYLFPTNNSTISGPSVVCSSGSTFSVSSLPDVDSINWETGPYLTVYSGQHTDSAIIKATGNGSSWVTARLVTDCGSITLPQQDAWAGKTRIDNIQISNHGGGMPGTWCMFSTGNTFNINYQSEGNTTFQSYLKTTGGNVVESFTGSSGESYYNPSSPGFYIFETQATNTCGTTDVFRTFIQFTDCSQMMLTLSPNPTTGETTLSIESASETFKSKGFDYNAEWNMEVYSETMSLKEKKTKLKGKSTTIQTAGWTEGVYTVRVKYKDEILTGKLVVKR